mmetsp:Transcript_10732/g.20139  ORF Transcript_10732/g.20139 Transcript_10732/m.20139 type:complete len:135 (+) Transcript_10732:3-407(+)
MLGLFTQQPFASLIVKGDKSVETREYPLPQQVIGKKVQIFISNGPEHDDSASTITSVGEVVFSTCFKYSSEKQWLHDEHRHKVSTKLPNYRWNDNVPKYGWVVKSHLAFDKPKTILCEERNKVIRSLTRISSKL